MSKRKRAKDRPEVTFGSASAFLEEALAGPVRDAILHDLAHPRDPGASLEALGEGMRTHRFQAGGRTLSFERIVSRLDRLNREDGFHVLNDWDGVADRFNPDTIPLDVLNFLAGSDPSGGSDRTVLAILLDYYFLYVVALLALRVWDEGDPNRNLDTVSGLIAALQGSKGSGERFVTDAETLILVAISHFESDERAYDRLLDRIRKLGPAHRTRMALVQAPVLASHLRFGFEATYGRDVVKMRRDNAPDYPWLSFALVTLMEDYARLRENGISGVERDRVVEALVNGLSPDPRAFVGTPPDSLSAHEAEVARFRDLFASHRSSLLEEFQRFQPSEERYSPIAFYFNFAHNLLKAVVVDALFRRKPWTLSVNDLFAGAGKRGAESASSETLARTLMEYARKSPDRIRGRLVPVIVYDPRKGRRAFTTTLQKLEQTPAG